MKSNSEIIGEIAVESIRAAAKNKKPRSCPACSAPLSGSAGCEFCGVGKPKSQKRTARPSADRTGEAVTSGKNTPPGPARNREKRNAVLFGLVIAFPIPLMLGFQPGIVMDPFNIVLGAVLLCIALFAGK